MNPCTLQGGRQPPSLSQKTRIRQNCACEKRTSQYRILKYRPG